MTYTTQRYINLDNQTKYMKHLNIMEHIERFTTAIVHLILLYLYLYFKSISTSKSFVT